MDTGKFISWSRLTLIWVILPLLMACDQDKQPYTKENSTTISIKNDLVSRDIFYDQSKGTITTQSLLIKGDTTNYTQAGGAEFSFNLNEKIYNGHSGWDLVSVSDTLLPSGENQTEINLKARMKPFVEITLKYQLYSQSPFFRKQIVFTNAGNTELKVESVNVEDFRLSNLWGGSNTVIYRNYARQKHLGPFVGNWDDALVMVHNPTSMSGLVIGNEAPGVLKQTAVFNQGSTVQSGLTSANTVYPFRKWLKAGETWESPKVFTGIYHNRVDPWSVLNTDVNDFVSNHLGARVLQSNALNQPAYNTWNPFDPENLSEEYMKEVIPIAAASGFSTFIIDAGWYTNLGEGQDSLEWFSRCGDWVVDPIKFPNGLEPIFDLIREHNMKPGLWISVGTTHKHSKVYKQNPEWFVRDAKGNPTNLHNPTQDMHTACFGTDWYDYIKEVIAGYVKNHGLAYVKLDLSVVTSAYTSDPAISGCYATNHPLHKDHEESLLVIYERLYSLFDELRAEVPDFYIDCTFETAGKYHLVDYALVKHAHGNWLANFDEPLPGGALRLRNLAWWRSPAMPASALVIGNLRVNDPMFELAIMSVAGSYPMMLGDLREVPRQNIPIFNSWLTFLKECQNEFQIFQYRQDLPGFGEPAEGMWDGFVRINTNTHSGGIIGVFRNGSMETKRTITLPMLNENNSYRLTTAPYNKTIGTFSGKQLIEKGIEVSLTTPYSGSIIKVEKIN